MPVPPEVLLAPLPEELPAPPLEVPGKPPLVGAVSLVAVVLVLVLVLPVLVLVLPVLVLPVLVLPVLVLPVLVPSPEVVSPAGRHILTDWQVSPSPRQRSSGKHGPPWTSSGGAKQSCGRVHAFAGWQVLPPSQSPSLMHMSATQIGPQWDELGKLSGGQSSGGGRTTSARAEPANRTANTHAGRNQ